jgi:hypothetical protein
MTYDPYDPQATSADDLSIVLSIVTRAGEIADRQQVDIDRLGLIMDVCATHYRHPLDLRGLLEATPFDFTHDITGIVRHLDRKTGELTDGFMPRYARGQ